MLAEIGDVSSTYWTHRACWEPFVLPLERLAVAAKEWDRCTVET
jgi:hypothetical protein